MALHELADRGVDPLGARRLDRDVRHRVGAQGFESLDVLGLRARELWSAVGERDRRAALRERDRRLQRAVAAADDEHRLARELLGIVQAVEDLAGILAGHAELAEVARAADRDDHTAREELLAAAQPHRELAAFAFDAFHVRDPRPDAALERLCVELGDQRLLHRRAELQLARRRHVGRVGEDRLRLREVDDRRERFARFEQLELEPGLLRFERRRHPGHAAADDHQVLDAWLALLRFRVEAGVGDDRPHRARAGVGGELEQRDPGQVADDVEPGHVGRAVLADLGQLLDGPRGPAGVEPLRVATDEADHRMRFGMLAYSRVSGSAHLDAGSRHRCQLMGTKSRMHRATAGSALRFRPTIQGCVVRSPAGVPSAGSERDYSIHWIPHASRRTRTSRSGIGWHDRERCDDPSSGRLRPSRSSADHLDRVAVRLRR
jgi:hypothetical protein